MTKSKSFGTLFAKIWGELGCTKVYQKFQKFRLSEKCPEKSKNPGGGSDRFWTKSILKLHFFSRASLTRHHALLSDRLQVLSRVRQLLPSARSLLPLLHIGPAGPALPVLHSAGCSRPGPVPLCWALWPAALLLLLAWVALNFPHHNQFIGN